MPGVNKEAMLLHLQQISKETPEGRHAVVGHLFAEQDFQP
jgi:hypothetical protein